MAAYMKADPIKGQITDAGHKEWIEVSSMSAPIYRSIPAGAKDTQRTQGDTTLGDIVVSRNLDKSSVKLEEACANGTFFKEVEIHFCTQVSNKQETYLSYLLKNVIISSYSIHANEKGDPNASEQLTLAYTEVEWTYNLVNPESGKKESVVPGKFAPGKNVS